MHNDKWGNPLLKRSFGSFLLGEDHVRDGRFDFCERRRKWGRPSRYLLATIAMWLSFDGFIYHATVEGGVPSQALRISLKLEKSMTFIAMRRLIVQRSKSGQKTF